MKNKILVAGGNLREWSKMVQQYIAECEAVDIEPNFQGLAEWQRHN